MDNVWPDILWKQFAAAIDMLGEAIRTCPAELWHTPLWMDPVVGGKFSEFWYIAFHCLFWLDVYLSGSSEGFMPPAPFTLSEFDPEGTLPDHRYSPVELLAYLAYCRQKCYATLGSLTDERALTLCHFPWTKDGIRFGELLLDDMRHVQEHGAQLHMFLGQQKGIASRWVGQIKEN